MTAKSKTTPTLRFPGFEGAWEDISLSEAISSLDAGVSVNSEDIPVKGSELGILKTSCVTKGFFDSSENKRVLDPAEIRRLKEPVSKDSIIISRMNTPALVGLSGLVPQAEKRLFLPDRLWAAKVSPRHSPHWIAQLLASEKVRGQLSDRASGTSGSMKNITKGDVLSLPVIIATLPEQRKIADFLTAVDGRIGQLSQKKALLEDYKKGVMQQLFTQALRFKDDHGNDFPDWEENEFGKIAKRASEKHNPMTSGTEYPSVELESLSQGTGQLLQLFVSTDQKSIKSKFTKGDVLFGKLRPYLRKWLMASFDGVCSSEIWVLRGRTVTNAYLYQLIQTDEFMKATNVSSGSKMPRADWNHIAAVSFSYPASTDEQTKIANFLTALDRKIESVAQQITHTQTFKKGLLQQMFV